MRKFLILIPALAFAGFLGSHRGDNAQPVEGMNVVYALSTHLCPQAGVAEGCAPDASPWRPAYASMSECMGNLDVLLNTAAESRLLGRCEKMKEI